MLTSNFEVRLSDDLIYYCKTKILHYILIAILIALLAISYSARAGTNEFHYDALGRLVQSCTALPGDGELAQYSLDPAANRTNYANTKIDINLLPNTGIYSPNGNFMLWMQPDNNLVAYGNFGSGWTPLGWSTNTVGSGASHAYFQSDGNLVLYTASGTSVWASHTDVNLCASIAVRNDGNVVITSATGTLLWQSGTGGH